MLWSTKLPGSPINTAGNGEETVEWWYPIPMHWIFDVDYWNTFADEHHGVPRLVSRIDPPEDNDCWQERQKQEVPPTETTGRNNVSRLAVVPLNALQRAALEQGSLGPISNLTAAYIQGDLYKVSPRQIDYGDVLTKHSSSCRNPVPYGGGRFSGQLWRDYQNYRKWNATVDPETGQSMGDGPIPHRMDEWVLRALAPAPRWRRLAQECVPSSSSSSSSNGTNRSSSVNNNNNYIALHARVELEMMTHECGAWMERNLTKIMERIQRRLQKWTDSSSLLSEQRRRAVALQAVPPATAETLSGLFIAVSRQGMEENDTVRYRQFRSYADENLRLLNQLVAQERQLEIHNKRTGSMHQIPVFTCGERILERYYEEHPDVPDHGNLLESVLNFHLAVQSLVFVGVRGSSYSTDVWMTRYLLGNGATNFRYTRRGYIEPIGNGGKPQPHTNCPTSSS